MISLPAIGSREEESFAAVGERRLVGMTMEAGRGSFIYGGTTCSRGQDLSIRGLVIRKNRMHRNIAGL